MLSPTFRIWLVDYLDEHLRHIIKMVMHAVEIAIFVATIGLVSWVSDWIAPKGVLHQTPQVEKSYAAPEQGSEDTKQNHKPCSK